MKKLYTARATSIAGREGRVETDDKQISMQLSRPGSNQPGTNPEQLFASGYSACFGGALAYIAKQQGIELKDVKIEATVDLNQDDNGFFISAGLNAVLPHMDRAQAAKLVEAAHAFCPYSKATRGNIKVDLLLNGEPLVKAA